MSSVSMILLFTLLKSRWGWWQWLYNLRYVLSLNTQTRIQTPLRRGRVFCSVMAQTDVLWKVNSQLTLILPNIHKHDSHTQTNRPWTEFAYTATQEENSRWDDVNIGNLL